MACQIEVLFTPAECRGLRDRDLSKATCVVFDVLRATSTMVTALANGANAVIPVEEISEAMVLHKQQPEFLLAGERDGLRIRAAQSGGVDFDLGNSPREYIRDRVAGKTIVTTTTNGTMALHACALAGSVLAGSFLNLAATTLHLIRNTPTELLLVCAGTGENAALEDVVAAGALCDLLTNVGPEFRKLDSASVAWHCFLNVNHNVAAAIRESDNARRLLTIPELRDDVEFCLRRECFPLVAALGRNGALERLA